MAHHSEYTYFLVWLIRAQVIGLDSFFFMYRGRNRQVGVERCMKKIAESPNHTLEWIIRESEIL